PEFERMRNRYERTSTKAIVKAEPLLYLTEWQRKWPLKAPCVASFPLYLVVALGHSRPQRGLIAAHLITTNNAIRGLLWKLHSGMESALPACRIKLIYPNTMPWWK